MAQRGREIKDVPQSEIAVEEDQTVVCRRSGAEVCMTMIMEELESWALDGAGEG